jgi:hypothetical protein
VALSWSWGWIACAFLLGCGTLQTYPGPAAPREQVATIEAAVLSGTEIKISSIDGIRLSKLQWRAELLPGRHELRTIVVFHGISKKVGRRFQLEFEAQAGSRYQILAELYEYGPRLWITDERQRTVAEIDPGMAPRGRSYGAVSQQPEAPPSLPGPEDGNETPQPPSPQ